MAAKKKAQTARKKRLIPRAKSAGKRPAIITKIRTPTVRKQARLSRIRRTMRYEIGNLVTHAAGLGLAVSGAIFLFAKSAATHDGVRIASFIVYGISLIILYASSTIYHSLWDARAKKVLRRLDHSAIYMLIAGTLTPVALLTVRGLFGTTMVAVIWSFAAIGIGIKLLFPHKYSKASVGAYIVMGWIGIAAIKQVYLGLPAPALWLLLAGGLSYTLGTIFYSMRRLPFNHMIWHFFVLGGSICHFASLYLYV